MMPSYKELLHQREALDRQIADMRRRAFSEAIEKVRALIREHELTADDVFGRKVRYIERQKVAPKYKDPATGATWTGRGKPPKWIAGKAREEFAIS